MLRTIGKTLGGAIAVLCLVSTLAIAGEMTCVKDDGKGTCTAAAGPDGREVIVVGSGLKTGEQMNCTDRGNMIECRVIPAVPPVAMAGKMTCVKDDGKGTCTAATGPDGSTIIVVGSGLKTGEQMVCMDRGNMIECRAAR